MGRGAAIGVLVLGACVSPSFEEGYRCPDGVCPPGQMCGGDGFCRRMPVDSVDGATADGIGVIGLDSSLDVIVTGPADAPVDGVPDAVDCLSLPAPAGCTTPLRFTCGTDCYVWCHDLRSYTDALTACSGWRGGHLAVVSSVGDADCVDAQVTDAVWIGLSQEGTATTATGNWRWTPNISTFFGRWDGGEPMDADGTEDHQEDCGRLSLNERWHDIQCGSTVQYLCEL